MKLYTIHIDDIVCYIDKKSLKSNLLSIQKIKEYNLFRASTSIYAIKIVCIMI